jgi:hypothetical protein
MLSPTDRDDEKLANTFNFCLLQEMFSAMRETFPFSELVV